MTTNTITKNGRPVVTYIPGNCTSCAKSTQGWTQFIPGRALCLAGVPNEAAVYYHTGTGCSAFVPGAAFYPDNILNEAALNAGLTGQPARIGWAVTTQEDVLKHDGGSTGRADHPSGSPQAVHGGQKLQADDRGVHAKLGAVKVLQVMRRGRLFVEFTGGDGFPDHTIVDAAEVSLAPQSAPPVAKPAAANPPTAKPTPRLSAARQKVVQANFLAEDPFFTGHDTAPRRAPALPAPAAPAPSKVVEKQPGVYEVDVDGAKKIFEPGSQEPVVNRDKGADSNLYQRKTAVSDLAEKLGLRAWVPETVTTSMTLQGPRGPYSAAGALSVPVSGRKPTDAEFKNAPNGDEIAVLDALTLQTGRYKNTTVVDADGNLVLRDNSLSYMRAAQGGENNRESPFQTQWANQPIPAHIQQRLDALTDADYAAILPAGIDPQVKQQAFMTLHQMQQTGLIPPPLTGKWWQDPGGQVAAARETFKPAMDTALQRLTGAFPDAKVSGRLKTVESIVRDAPRLGGNRTNQHDTVGTRVIVAGGLADQKAAVERVRAMYAGQIVSENAIGLPNMGSPRNAPTTAKEGYRSVHFVVTEAGKPVEIQVRTPRQDFLGEYTHNDWNIPELDDNPNWHAYANAMSERYYKLDAGEDPGPMPKVPWEVKYHPGGPLPADPLAVAKTAMLDSALRKRLSKTLPGVFVKPVSEEEASLLRSGQPVSAQTDEHHAAHLAHHAELRKHLLQRVLRGLEKMSVLDNIDDHIRLHQQLSR